MIPKELLKKIRRIQIRTSHMANDLLARQFAARLTSSGDSWLPTLRTFDLPETERAPSHGPPPPLDSFETIQIEIDQTPVGHFATGATHLTRRGSPVEERSQRRSLRRSGLEDPAVSGDGHESDTDGRLRIDIEQRKLSPRRREAVRDIRGYDQSPTRSRWMWRPTRNRC